MRRVIITTILTGALALGAAAPVAARSSTRELRPPDQAARYYCLPGHRCPPRPFRVPLPSGLVKPPPPHLPVVPNGLR